MPARTRAVAIGTFALCTASWAMWLADPDEVSLFALVVVVTAAAAFLVALTAPVPRERCDDRWLAAAIVTIVPAAGPLVAAWMIELRGAAGTGAQLLWDPTVAPPAIDGTELARRLTRALPPCEALAGGDAELRRATVGRLARRATADDVQLLRWARRRNRDVAVEVALAFEDIDERFATRLREARDAAAARRDAGAHAELFSLIAHATLTKVVDVTLVAALVAEARIHHDALAALDPDRAAQLAPLRAQLDLATCRPELVPPADPDSELGKLHITAAYARRIFTSAEA